MVDGAPVRLWPVIGAPLCSFMWHFCISRLKSRVWYLYREWAGLLHTLNLGAVLQYVWNTRAHVVILLCATSVVVHTNSRACNARMGDSFSRWSESTLRIFQSYWSKSQPTLRPCGKSPADCQSGTSTWSKYTTTTWQLMLQCSKLELPIQYSSTWSWDEVQPIQPRRKVF
jgi:hypothetical protein